MFISWCLFFPLLSLSKWTHETFHIDLLQSTTTQLKADMNLIHISFIFIVMWKPVPVDKYSLLRFLLKIIQRLNLILFIICIIRFMKAVYNLLSFMQYSTSSHLFIVTFYSILLRIFKSKYSTDLKDFQTEFVSYLKYHVWWYLLQAFEALRNLEWVEESFSIQLKSLAPDLWLHLQQLWFSAGVHFQLVENPKSSQPLQVDSYQMWESE